MPATSRIWAWSMGSSPMLVKSAGKPAAEPQGEATAGEPVHGRGEGGRDQGMPGVVVRRRGSNADALTDRARRPRTGSVRL